MATKGGLDQPMSKGSESSPLTIGILSDTHGYLDESIISRLRGVDEIWHAGDIGVVSVAETLSAIRPFRAVYGNIDGREVRDLYPEFLSFNCGGVNVLMTHIGGRAGKYSASLKAEIAMRTPDLFICGHSHILQVAPVGKMLHINPGAAGRHGFHHIRTMVILTIEGGRIRHLDVVELGPRSERSRSSDPVG